MLEKDNSKIKLFEGILFILHQDTASYIHLMSHDRERIAKSIVKRLFINKNNQIDIKK